MKTQLTLGDLITPARVRRAGDSELPILSMTMRGGLVDQSKKFKKRIASADTAPYKRVLREQLVVGFPIDEGVLSFQSLYDEAIVSPAYDVWDLCKPNIVDWRYLERLLRSPRALAFYKAKLQGTTARRRTLPDEVFLALPLELPEVELQHRALEMFEKADSLHRRRQEAIRLANDFLRSESPRVLRRLQPLRRWSHEKVNQVFTGSARTRCTHGARAPWRIPIPVGGH